MIPVHKSTDFSPEVGAVNTGQGVEGQEFLNRECALLSRYQLQRELVGALEKTEFHAHLASKVLNCHTQFRLRRCDQNHAWAKVSNSCGVRLCSHCAHQKAETAGNKVEQFSLGKTNLKYLVLAERNSKNLQEGIKSLYASWDRLRRSVFWKRNVAGCIAVLEVTYSVKRKDWHPHLNILLEGEYMPFKLLNLKWKKATRQRGQTSRIQKANNGTVAELLKYTLKIAEYREGEGTEGRVLEILFDDPRVLDEFLSAVYGVRLIRTYGSFRSMGDVEVEEEKCPDCGSTCFVDCGALHLSQLSFDFDKQVFRPVVSLKKPPRDWLGPTAFCPVSLNYEIRQQAVGISMAVEARQRMRHYEREVAFKFAA